MRLLKVVSLSINVSPSRSFDEHGSNESSILRYTFTIRVITVISLQRLKLRRLLTTPSTAIEVLSHQIGPREAETSRKGGNNGRERTGERATDGQTNERTDSVRCSRHTDFNRYRRRYIRRRATW
ncbi:uncharacterized protein LOC116185770 [Apis dorsata]|uniref:uncharacterized protein LOC116185770 n=1 Tax=Apis dorsata TaxID=7462 RepID=UPI0012932360|nr:uncharacterized protein LOC116185770 [Apis dorsata]